MTNGLAENRRPKLNVTVYPNRPTKSSIFRKQDGPFTVKLIYFVGNTQVRYTLVNLSFDTMQDFVSHRQWKNHYVHYEKYLFWNRVTYCTYMCGIHMGAAVWVENYLKTHPELKVIQED